LPLILSVSSPIEASIYWGLKNPVEHSETQRFVTRQVP